MNYLLPNTYLKKNCFKVLHIIGQGGFGITYLGEETGFIKLTNFGEEFEIYDNPKKVVIKELFYQDFCQRGETSGVVSISNSERKLEFEKLVNKQLEEGKTLKKLNHPHIVKTKDIFKENATAYMVMDYIDGQTLDEIVNKTGKLSKKNALNYVSQVLSAIVYIHDKKILHLDITPSNILIKEDTQNVFLVDFGSSLTYGINNHIESTTSKLISGFKKHYAPFEQQDIDNLKEFNSTLDTYAIGATLYFLLTGFPPPISSNVIIGKEKIIPPSIYSKSPDINDYLDAVVLKALSPMYTNRYNSALDMQNAINKEAGYQLQLNTIYSLLAQNKYQEAFEIAENTKHLFLPTQTLIEIRKSCIEKIENKRKESEYENFLRNATDLLNRQKYNDAINLFEKAALLFPENENLQNKVQFYRNKIEEQKNKLNEKTVLLSKLNSPTINSTNNEIFKIAPFPKVPFQEISFKRNTLSSRLKSLKKWKIYLMPIFIIGIIIFVALQKVQKDYYGGHDNDSTVNTSKAEEIGLAKKINEDSLKSSSLATQKKTSRNIAIEDKDKTKFIETDTVLRHHHTIPSGKQIFSNNFPVSIIFHKQTISLTGDSKSILLSVSLTLKSNPSISIRLNSYSGTSEKNQMLAQRRLDATQKFLVESLGISGDRISKDNIVGGGDENVVDINKN
jgi:serine/threonine protein kinase